MIFINKEKVFTYFSELSGDSDKIKYDKLMERAISAVSSKLKPNVDSLENENRLCYLCGATAFFEYILICNVSKADNVKTLDLSLSIDKKTIVDTAKIILDNAYFMARDLLLDDDFYFAKV